MSTHPGWARRALTSFHKTAIRRDRDDDVKPIGVKLSKPAMIGIAIGVIVVVLAVAGGIAFWLIRRRRNKKARPEHGSPRVVVDYDDPAHLNERSSKVPLIGQEEHTQMREMHFAAPGYDEDDEHAPLAPMMPRRTLSEATTRSIPPSYAAATQHGHKLSVELDATPGGHHRRGSSVGGSGGLRPLALVTAHQDDEHSPKPQDSPERKNHRNRLSVLRPNTRTRSRSASRFREEDLDM